MKHNSRRHSHFGYFIREGIDSIFTHGFKSFATICAIIACLIIMGTVGLLMVNVRSMINTLESENQMLAYINDRLSNEEARALQSAIEQTENVRSAYFIDRETAMESFKEQYEDTELLEDLEPTVLRHRYIIYMDDISLMAQTRDALRDIRGIETVSAHLEIAKGFMTVRSVVSVVSFGFILILFVVSLFVMSNTIKLTTYERRDEIAIMKMVGAKSSFIRWPFVVEGMLLGSFGSLVAFVAEWGIYRLLADRIIGNTGLSFLRVVPFFYLALPMLIAFLIIGLGVGILGSVFAIRGYLKV